MVTISSTILVVVLIFGGVVLSSIYKSDLKLDKKRRGALNISYAMFLIATIIYMYNNTTSWHEFF